MLRREAALESLADGTLVEKAIPIPERTAFLEVLSQGRARIDETFGRPSARPVIVLLRHSDTLWPFTFNDYASTSFYRQRACIVVGPSGTNVDVVAHELMHAELLERVGWWRRLVDVPTWFDEGVAMQVDFRARYDVPRHEPSAGETRYVRSLMFGYQFFQGDDEELTQHYAAAKTEVALWLASVGRQALYSRLARLRTGERFDAVIDR